MYKQKNKVWLKAGITVSIAILVLFLINGLIVVMINHGACLTPPCSAGSGYCPTTFSGCFEVGNNFMATVLEIPTFIMFYSTPVMNDFYNNIITYPFDFLDRIFNYQFNNFIPILQILIINLILYFAVGVFIGWVYKKIKSHPK